MKMRFLKQQLMLSQPQYVQLLMNHFSAANSKRVKNYICHVLNKCYVKIYNMFLISYSVSNLMCLSLFTGIVIPRLFFS